MVTYSCDQCGMQVTNLTCGSAVAPLSTSRSNATAILLAFRVPPGCGRIKSPMCCGSDMEAAA